VSENFSRDCFWCGLVYDTYANPCCISCGSRLEQDALGPLAGEFNKRPDYSGPDMTDKLAERERRVSELLEKEK
jgi:hypothetical protein